MGLGAKVDDEKAEGKAGVEVEVEEGWREGKGGTGELLRGMAGLDWSVSSTRIPFPLHVDADESGRGEMSSCPGGRRVHQFAAHRQS